MAEKQRQSFMVEALVISASNFIVKIIGMLFKIPMSNMMQANFGIFTAAYSIYAMLYMISTAGLPVAISKMIAASAKLKRKVEIKRIFMCSIVIFGIIGFICTLVMYFGAEGIANFSEHSDSALAMKIISPTLFFVCISSAIRGYFQGFRNMVPTAISQFVEAFLKMCVGVAGVAFAINKGYTPPVQAAFGISGVSIGAFAAMLFLIFAKKQSGKQPVRGTIQSDSYKEILKKIAKIALPVTITSSALYLSQFLDTFVINRCLIASGVSADLAEKLYSTYTTLAITISDLLPSTLVYPIAVSILPAVSASVAAKKEKETRRYIHNSIRISSIIAFPCAFGLFAVAKPVISVVYGANWGGAIDIGGKVYMPVDIATVSLKILAIGIIFISLLSTTNALLQACGKSYLPMISLSVGVVFLVAFEIVLVSIKPLGIHGAPLSSVIFYFIALMLNMLALRKHGRYVVSLKKLFLKPFVCALLCGAGATLVTELLLKIIPNNGRLLSLVVLSASAAVGIVIYVGTMLICKGITKEEILILPKGKTILAFLQKKGMYN